MDPLAGLISRRGAGSGVNPNETTCSSWVSLAQAGLVATRDAVTTNVAPVTRCIAANNTPVAVS
jgi:hypothetical protein